MSDQVPPAELCRRVAAALSAARAVYPDVASELVRLRDATPAEQAVGLDGLRRIARELGIGLVVVARTIEQTTGGRRNPPADDPRPALPLLRALADSLVMLDAPSFAELVGRPISSPAEIERLWAQPALVRFMARHALQG